MRRKLSTKTNKVSLLSITQPHALVESIGTLHFERTMSENWDFHCTNIVAQILLHNISFLSEVLAMQKFCVIHKDQHIVIAPIVHEYALDQWCRWCYQSVMYSLFTRPYFYVYIYIYN